jgi:hypothetical protein
MCRNLAAGIVSRLHSTKPLPWKNTMSGNGPLPVGV